MVTRFVTVDRDTPMLLPPDLREWVPEDDMVYFVIEAVAGMNLPTLKINRRGSGSEQYPPKMMLQLLIYCYANGIFSSRRIERATYRDVAVRFLTAGIYHLGGSSSVISKPLCSTRFRRKPTSDPGRPVSGSTTKPSSS